MSVVERATNRRVAQLVGYRRRWDACPSDERIGSFYARVIVPAKTPLSPGPAPLPSTVVAARRREGESVMIGVERPNMKGVSGAAIGCTHVDHPGAFEESRPLLIRDESRTHTVYPKIGGLEYPARVLDATCQADEILVLARSSAGTHGNNHFLIRYTRKASVLQVFVQVAFEADHAPNPLPNRNIDSFHARGLHWEGNEVTFTLFALSSRVRRYPYVSRAYDYLVTLPPPEEDLR
jgi:hypothetical protein